MVLVYCVRINQEIVIQDTEEVSESPGGSQ